MASFNVPNSDNGALAVFLQVKNATIAHAATLGFDVGVIDAATAAHTDFAADLTAVADAKAAAKAAVADKDAQRAVSLATVRSIAQQVKNNPAATNAIKTDFGINVTPPATPPVTVPSELSATPNATGTAKLKWKRNGNISGTVYLVETMTLASGEWTLFGTTTKTTFVDPTATPGVQKSYRVRAQRNTTTSEPCSSATIYNGEGFGGLELAA